MIFDIADEAKALGCHYKLLVLVVRISGCELLRVWDRDATLFLSKRSQFIPISVFFYIEWLFHFLPWIFLRLAIFYFYLWVLFCFHLYVWSFNLRFLLGLLVQFWNFHVEDFIIKFQLLIWQFQRCKNFPHWIIKLPAILV